MQVETYIEDLSSNHDEERWDATVVAIIDNQREERYEVHADPFSIIMRRIDDSMITKPHKHKWRSGNVESDFRHSVGIVARQEG